MIDDQEQIMIIIIMAMFFVSLTLAFFNLVEETNERVSLEDCNSLSVVYCDGNCDINDYDEFLICKEWLSG